MGRKRGTGIIYKYCRDTYTFTGLVYVHACIRCMRVFTCLPGSTRIRSHTRWRTRKRSDKHLREFRQALDTQVRLYVGAFARVCSRLISHLSVNLLSIGSTARRLESKVLTYSHFKVSFYLDANTGYILMILLTGI